MTQPNPLGDFKIDTSVAGQVKLCRPGGTPETFRVIRTLTRPDGVKELLIEGCLFTVEVLPEKPTDDGSQSHS